MRNFRKRLLKVGFDFPNAQEAFKKVKEETDELEQAISNGDKENMAEELGDLLFSVVNVSRFLKVDSEQALYFACDKFTHRFRKMEELAKQRNIDMDSTTLSQLDSLWNEVK